ncbi:MAG TPA: phosphoribosylglycinamide formyltransferase [Miltoncostaeaceae bacterium]|nr:phosphoribosylglycinamide formyltransferase [Miltoncostaeaceae bacterium]
MSSEGSYRIVVLVSGSGTNLQSLIDSVHRGPEGIEIVQVVSSRADAMALERAERAGIPTAVVALEGDDRAERDRRLVAAVDAARPDLVVLAGWMSILTGVFLNHFRDRVINLHPSLLPAFPGLGAIEQALEWGVRLTGVTVHYAEEVVDAGPPVLQRAVPVFDDDDVETLTARIRIAEHEIVPEAVRLFAAGKVHRDPRERRKVVVADEDRRVS